MENELYEALNKCGITVTECAKALNNLFSVLQNVGLKITNNYLKMHGYTIRRGRALKTFERRHRSG